MRTRLLAVFAAAVVLSASADPKPVKQTPAKPVEIPFTLEGGNIVVDVELTPGRTLPFVFDSGLSDGHIVSADAARVLGIKGSEELSIGDASGDSHSGSLTKIPSIRVGGARLSDQLFAILDIPDQVTRRPGKPALAGFLGAPLMKDAVLCLDYERRKMQRWARRDFDPAARSSVPMKLNHELPTIVVSIDGQRATMIVDSGNNGAVVLYPAFVEKSGFRKRYPKLAASTGSDGGGQPYEVLTAEAGFVEISPEAIFQHVPLAVIPQGMDPAWGIDGMVGFEVLSRLNPCLDREGQRFLFGGG
ncbi:MAG: pepsin/retropepsin-like aspartic protease family protein [Panacagrimonas sp.]